MCEPQLWFILKIALDPLFDKYTFIQSKPKLFNGPWYKHIIIFFAFQLITVKNILTCLRNNMARYNGVDLFPDSCDTIDKKYGFFSLSMPTYVWCTVSNQIRQMCPINVTYEKQQKEIKKKDYLFSMKSPQKIMFKLIWFFFPQ